jgi:hypothetical protein
MLSKHTGTQCRLLHHETVISDDLADLSDSDDDLETEGSENSFNIRYPDVSNKHMPQQQELEPDDRMDAGLTNNGQVPPDESYLVRNELSLVSPKSIAFDAEESAHVQLHDNTEQVVDSFQTSEILLSDKLTDAGQELEQMHHNPDLQLVVDPKKTIQLEDGSFIGTKEQ